MPGGRPTDYRTEHCDGVVAAGQQGKTLTWFAASIGQSRRVIYHWIDAHPEFSHACGRARAAFQAFWEDRFGAAVGDRNQNANALLTFMAATCEDFRQSARLEIEHKGQVQVRSLPREELLRLAGEAIIEAEVLEKPAQLPGPAEPEPSKNSQTG